jgi:CelD/BcsL family acetyltransferase involved in cellulose biosynthesis
MDQGLGVQVFRSFEPVRDAWINLQEDAYCLGFQHYSWLSTVWETVGRTRPGRLAIVLVSDMTGNPLMLIPLVERRQGGIRVLEFIDYELSDYNAPLIRRAFIDELGGGGFRPLWQKILTRIGSVDAVRLEKMPPVIDGVENPFLQLDTQQEHWTFQAPLTGGFDAFVSRRTKRFMRNLHRRRRNLAKLGTVELRTATDPQEAMLLLDEIFRYRAIRCQEMGLENTYESNPSYMEFYREMCRRELGGIVRVGSLTVDGRMVAAHLSLVFRSRLYGLIQASDFTNFGLYSPGGLMMLELIKQCCDQGISTVDFTLGSETYKADWTDDATPLYRHDHGLTTLGKLMLALDSGYTQLKAVIKKNPRLLALVKIIRTRLKKLSR